MENSKLGELMTAFRAARDEVKAAAAQAGFKVVRGRLCRTPLVRLGRYAAGFEAFPPALKARVRVAEIADCVLNDSGWLVEELEHFDTLLFELRSAVPFGTMKAEEHQAA
jgi:hypothetical protein